MEEKTKIENIRLYPDMDTDQIKALATELAEKDSRELLLFPHPVEKRFFVGLVLAKYASEELTGTACVREIANDENFLWFLFSRSGLPSYVRYLSRQMLQPLATEVKKQELNPSLVEFLTEQQKKTTPPTPVQDGFDDLLSDPLVMSFLKVKTPAIIEQELNEHVIGQEELTKAVADFLYYHALRQVHPELPQRPMLISGPSGSGKTEVWRVAKKLYGHTFPIKVIDGSSMSCDGWSGSFKISTYVDANMSDGGILVVDEFDKLTKPKFSARGENVSQDMQAEFLKLIEGEYNIAEGRKQTNMTSKRMGFVLVGAFESLRTEKQNRQTRKQVSRIGFCTHSADTQDEEMTDCNRFTDEDFISYGVMPEIVGRIAVKCVTQPLNDEVYLDIIRSPHSRVAMIERVLKQYGISINDVISNEELRQMVAKSKSNRTGVRWVSAQVETKLLEALREDGLFPSNKKERNVA